MAEARGLRRRQYLQRLAGGVKRYTYGTHRVRAPEDMLRSVLPRASLAGVTRVANITGLDRVGIPVAVCVRPNAQTLSQAAGKGLTLDQAILSAVMEGIELFHAESTTLPTRFEPYAAIAERHPVLPLEHLPLTRHSLFSPRIPERWTFGWDLIQQQRVAVPVDLVALGGRTQDPTHLFSFYSSSHGLACGATLVEAIVVGLLEVIEHDAVACWRVAADRFGQSIPRVRLETATGFPLVVRILDQLERARLRPIVYDCSVDTEVPVYWALLYDTTTRSVGVAEGSGAHVDPEVALVRALTEAAQARAVAIAGARDDCFGRDLMRIRLTDSRRRTELLESQPPTVDLRVRRSVASPAFGTDLEYLLGRLIQIGVTNVVAVELTQSEYRGVLSAVRVIVPMLAGPGFEDGHPSPRAEAFATRMAECS